MTNPLPNDKDITLRDVIAHIQAAEGRLGEKIEQNTRDIQANSREIQANSRDIKHLSARIDALEEDLTATIKDSVKIRRHVGLLSADE